MTRELKTLLRRELSEAIHEAALAPYDEKIATRILIDKMSQMEAATAVGYERTTISRRLPAIVGSVHNAAEKLGYIF